VKLGYSVIGAALAVAVLALTPPVQAQPVSLRVRGALLAIDPSSKAMEIFKTEAERRSGGTLAFEIVPATLDGGARELTDELRTQSAFAIWTPSSNLSRLVPEIGALGLPFVFHNFDQVARALRGPAGAVIEAKLAAKGFATLGWMDWGARHVTNAKRPLRVIEDFKGLKLRLLPNETHLAIFRAIGANPIAMDFKDVFPALRNGDIDGVETSYTAIDDLKLYEYDKYLSDSAHVHDLLVLLANKEMLTSLQPGEQKAIREAAAIACAQQWKMQVARDAEALAHLKEKGMLFDPLPPATRMTLRKATAGVIADARKRLGEKLVDSVITAAKPGAAKPGAARPDPAR
jgi:tripartite ATP-independent transporter DctP family solute receptor